VSARTAAEVEALAKLAYVAYCEVAGWRAPTGEPIPPWEQLPALKQEGWRAAVRALERAG
jgi:hypothetical protein